MDRIYKDHVAISEESTRDFWNGRAAICDIHNEELRGWNSVLLGMNDHETIARNLRVNDKDMFIIRPYIGNNMLNVLDIGCGSGRWASNLSSQITSYIGTDFSKNYVENCKIKYSSNRFSFFERDICDTQDLLQKRYDLVIIAGVFNYINDDKLVNFLSLLNNINSFGVLYIMATVSLLENRLTINEFYSNDLQSTYSSIYRTISEYDELFATHFSERFKMRESNTYTDVKESYNNETNLNSWVFVEHK